MEKENLIYVNTHKTDRVEPKSIVWYIGGTYNNMDVPETNNWGTVITNQNKKMEISFFPVSENSFLPLGEFFPLSRGTKVKVDYLDQDKSLYLWTFWPKLIDVQELQDLNEIHDCFWKLLLRVEFDIITDSNLVNKEVELVIDVIDTSSNTIFKTYNSEKFIFNTIKTEFTTFQLIIDEDVDVEILDVTKQYVIKAYVKAVGMDDFVTKTQLVIKNSSKSTFAFLRIEDDTLNYTEPGREIIWKTGGSSYKKLILNDIKQLQNRYSSLKMVAVQKDTLFNTKTEWQTDYIDEDNDPKTPPVVESWKYFDYITKENFGEAFNRLKTSFEVNYFLKFRMLASAEMIGWIDSFVKLVVLFYYNGVEVHREESNGWLESGYTFEITSSTNPFNLNLSNIYEKDAQLSVKWGFEVDPAISTSLGDGTKVDFAIELIEDANTFVQINNLAVTPPNIRIPIGQWFGNLARSNTCCGEAGEPPCVTSDNKIDIRQKWPTFNLKQLSGLSDTQWLEISEVKTNGETHQAFNYTESLTVGAGGRYCDDNQNLTNQTLKQESKNQSKIIWNQGQPVGDRVITMFSVILYYNNPPNASVDINVYVSVNYNHTTGELSYTTNTAGDDDHAFFVFSWNLGHSKVYVNEILLTDVTKLGVAKMDKITKKKWVKGDTTI